jgi:hypothetical protein
MIITFTEVITPTASEVKRNITVKDSIVGCKQETTHHIGGQAAGWGALGQLHLLSSALSQI